MMQINLEHCRPSLKPSWQITSLPPTKLTTKCIAAARLANQADNHTSPFTLSAMAQVKSESETQVKTGPCSPNG
jgi:hypothetical protein